MLQHSQHSQSGLAGAGTAFVESGSEQLEDSLLELKELSEELSELDSEELSELESEELSELESDEDWLSELEPDSEDDWLSDELPELESDELPESEELFEPESDEDWLSLELLSEELSEEALHCYWLGVLLRYAELYFSDPAAGRGAAS